MVYMYHSFLIHSSADGHLGCFHVLAIINSAAMNIGVHVSLSDLVSSVCMPRSGIAGSYGKICISNENDYLCKAANNIMKILGGPCTSYQTTLRSWSKGRKVMAWRWHSRLGWQDKQASFQYNLFQLEYEFLCISGRGDKTWPNTAGKKVKGEDWKDLPFVVIS